MNGDTENIDATMQSPDLQMDQGDSPAMTEMMDINHDHRSDNNHDHQSDIIHHRSTYPTW
jgi:hypothetical protein